MLVVFLVLGVNVVNIPVFSADYYSVTRKGGLCQKFDVVFVLN